MIRRKLGFVILVMMLAAIGCRTAPVIPELGAVTGTITLDGRPLVNATVIFTPAGPGRTSVAVTDADGRYALAYLRGITGANLGRHAVRITAANEANEMQESLPERYHLKTVLTAEVAAGPNTIDFDLKSK